MDGLGLGLGLGLGGESRVTSIYIYIHTHTHTHTRGASNVMTGIKILTPVSNVIGLVLLPWF